MIVLKILAAALLVLLLAVLLFLLILTLDAGLRILRRSPRRLYRERAGEEDFRPLSRIPKRLVNMVILSEDGGFRHHRGISLLCIRDAIRVNRRCKRLVTSGSTITQQLVKNLYLDFNRNVYRKLIEMILAVVTEWFLSKDEVMELYLNVIYYGCGTYGITEASRYYFDREPEALTVNQMFMLIRILNAPTANNPLRAPENYVISRDRRIRDWLQPAKKGLTAEEAEELRSYPVSRLDPALREATDEKTRFAAVPMRNERFGPKKRKR